MSAKLNSDGKAELELKSPLRDDLKAPSNEEVAACRPCRLALVVIFTLVLVAMLVAAIVVIATSKRCGKPLQRTEYWKKETFYQIHVPSFQDTSDDGKGDLKGIVMRLAYLESIGVKVLVLSGLVSDKEFQNFAKDEDKNEFGNLVSKAKERGISIVLEMDPTYTSSSSPWFQGSAASEKNAYRSWYHWSRTTNNWQSMSGGAAWQMHTSTNTSYYFYVDKDKPALNYNTSSVKDEFKKALIAWMDRGAKGFKLNNFQRLVVDGQYSDNPSSQFVNDKDLKATHNVLKEFHKVVATRGGFLMGALEEIADSKNTQVYYGNEKEKELDLVLNSHFTGTFSGNPGVFVNKTLSDYLQAVPSFSWPGWVFDGPEFKQRLGQRFTQKELVWLNNVLQLTLPGTPVFYYGDELGLKDVITEAMAWDNTDNGGFSKKNPWYSNSKVKQVTNVKEQKKKNETYTIFKQVNELRLKERSLQSLNVKVWYATGSVIIFQRYLKGHKSFVVGLNFGNRQESAGLSNTGVNKGIIRIDTKFEDISRELNLKQIINLKPFQGLILEVLN